MISPHGRLAVVGEGGSPVRSEAAAYFDDLWRRTSAAWQAEAIPPAVMRDGRPTPLDYCLSTIARVVDQPAGPVAALTSLQERLRPAGGDQFYYPAAAFHISLIGCTPREASKAAFSPARIARLATICRRVLANAGPLSLDLRGVGIIGHQLFVQVWPHDCGWARLRQALDDALTAAGERPLSYANKAPIHLNLIRLTDTRPAVLVRLLPAVAALRLAEFGRLTVARIDLVCTDFVVSPDTTDDLATFRLVGPSVASYHPHG